MLFALCSAYQIPAIGLDRRSKHGISVSIASRLGGVAVVLFVSVMMVVSILGVDRQLGIPYPLERASFDLYLGPITAFGLLVFLRTWI